MSAAPCCSQAAVGRSCARAAGPRAHSAAVSHGLGTEGSAGRLESRACPQRREAVQRAQGGGARRGQGIAWGPHFPAWALRGAREDAPRRKNASQGQAALCSAGAASAAGAGRGFCTRALKSRVRPEVPQGLQPWQRGSAAEPVRREEEKSPGGVKWTQLEHRGPWFAAPYEPLPEGGPSTTCSVIKVLKCTTAERTP
ncbi:uncharacterized protein LOC129626519 isoform X2 [Bubalus kerabau]|uniref:uncharacterized protein LOC129626519 isoform X2 n=1 Tax=Bubalus carabanensis TaxID=3119969 RepID=UPI00244EC050|nr:uncharacterized protein LOC129626519 isoform X2 [Bubalus carabanensis]